MPFLVVLCARWVALLRRRERIWLEIISSSCLSHVFLVCGWCSASAAVYALVGAHVADTFLNWAEVRLRQLHCLQRVNQWQHPCIGMSSTQHACNTHPSSPLIFLSDFALLHRHTHTRCLSGGFVPGSCLSSLLLICPFPFTIATTTMMKVCLMILKQG